MCFPQLQWIKALFGDEYFNQKAYELSKPNLENIFSVGEISFLYHKNSIDLEKKSNSLINR